MNLKSPSEQYMQFAVFRQRMEAAYTPTFKKSFQAQIHQYITYAEEKGYEQATALINVIVTGAPLELPLRKLYTECASKWGWKTYRDLPQKGFFQDGIVNRLLASINAYFDKYILNKVVVETTDYTRKWMRQQISAGLENGDGYDKIARSMVDSSVNLMRAKRIARTETVRASNYASLDAARLSPLLLKKEWIAAKDNRTRRVPRDTADHLNLDGITIGLDDWFNEFTTEGVQLLQHPGDINAGAASTINCFLPDQLTSVNINNIKKVFRSTYNGEVVTVKCADGYTFTCTINHPILTTKGWVSAGKLTNFHNLIKSDFVNKCTLENFKINNTPSTFEQIYNTLSGSFGNMRHNGTVMNFYGDGGNGNVDVINTERKLRNRIKLFKMIQNNIFQNTYFRKTVLFFNSRFYKPSSSLLSGTSFHGFIGTLNHFFSTIFTSLSSSKEHAFASAPAFNIKSFKPIANNIAGATEVSSKFFNAIPFGEKFFNFVVINLSSLRSKSAFWPKLNAETFENSVNGRDRDITDFRDFHNSLAGFVEANDSVGINDITHSNYSGFVYTFETNNQMYDINSLVARNCRCTLAYVSSRDNAGRLILNPQNARR